MYEHLLHALRIEHQFRSETLLADFLRNLQEPLKSLRNSYSAYPVSVDYSQKPFQLAYFMAYFPHYSSLLTYILVKHCENIETHALAQHGLGLFGGGPCPELIGYLHFLQIKHPTKTVQLEVFNFDIAAETWAYSRSMNMQHIVPQYLGTNIIEKFIVRKMDITTLLNITPTNNVPKIAVFQNCLNESALDKHPIIIQNFKSLFLSMPAKSTIIIIDFANYPEVVQLITKIETGLSKMDGFKRIRSVGSGIVKGVSPFAEIPPILKNNLLIGTNGLIPRKYITFTYSIICKI